MTGKVFWTVWRPANGMWPRITANRKQSWFHPGDLQSGEFDLEKFFVEVKASPPLNSRCLGSLWTRGLRNQRSKAPSLHAMRQGRQDRVEDGIEVFTKVFGQKAKHEKSILLKHRIFPGVR